MKKSEKERGKRSSIRIMPKCPIPKLLTYNNLVREISKIDIGYYFQEATEDDTVRGCFENWKSFWHAMLSFT